MITGMGADGLEAAAALCGRAFAGDPLYMAAEADPVRRERLARAIARLYLRYCARFGRVVATGAGPDGVMLLLPPEEYDLTAFKMIRSGALALPFHAGLGSLSRLSTVEGVAARAHERDAPRPHWYLLELAVEPAMQGRGIGSSLLRPFFAERDEAGESVYLDTQKEENVSMYERYGFELRSSTEIPHLPGVLHRSMVRLPRGSI